MQLINQNINLRDGFASSVIRSRAVENRFLRPGKNIVILEHFREGKLLQRYVTHNDITNEGKNHILNVAFNNGTQVANNSWFVGLVNLSSFTAFAAADTMSSHSGWLEFTAYTETTRRNWNSVTATSQSTSNTTSIDFTINASGTIKGIFVTSNSTKGGTTGVLWATAPFASDIPVANTDQLKVTYTVAT